MPASIQHESGNVYRVHVSGVLSKSDMENYQTVAAQEIRRRGKIKLLFILEQFQGWERGADWGDVTFFTLHDENIEQIAIVGEEKWRDHGLAFAGAGIRTAAVQFFSPAE
ncbi:MAG: STAS/SEC14 domain-containing protein, partial [Candidatus Methylomirabilota bacterium]